MNPTLHHPFEITIEPAVTTCSRPTPEFLCNLKIRYRANGAWQTYLGVWVPKELQSILATGDVCSVHMETLEGNGAATRALGYPVEFLVLAVETKAGKRVELVPPEMRAFKRDSLIVGGLACALGVAGLLQGWVWLGALALVLGTHALRASQRIPTTPFLVHSHRL